MWVIKDDILLSLPDDVPQPRGSHLVELPEGFHDNPGRWQVRNGAIVKAKPAKTDAKSGLSSADIAKLKAAIAAGKL